jgi:hypothetical protein
VLLFDLSPRMLRKTAVGLGRMTVLEGGAAALSFGVLWALAGPIAGAVAGLVVYALLLVGVWHLGLGRAWRYVRALHH